MSVTSEKMTRRAVIGLLNVAISAEYHSFVGHALGSNPYVKPEWESDLGLLEEIRDEENALTRALLLQLGRYRAGPTLRAFRLWKEDLNFLSLEWLVIRAAEEAEGEVARVEGLVARLPDDDVELAATFESLLLAKRDHAERLAPAAKKRAAERDARRATHRAVTAVKVKGLGAAGAGAAAAAAPAPAKKAGGPPAPKLPGGFKLPPSAPKPPGPPKPPAPPLPGGVKLPPSPPQPPASAAPAPPAGSGKWPPLPPGFQLPPRR